MQLTLQRVLTMLEETHRILIQEIDSPVNPVEVNEELTFRWEVSCTEQCFLDGANLKILDHVGLPVQELYPRSKTQGRRIMVEFTIVVLPKPGHYRWRVVFPEQEINGHMHDETEIPFSFTVKPHTTSLIVWDVPSYIMVNAPFLLKAGGKCVPASCYLKGASIVIQDEKKNRVGKGKLSSRPFPGTTDLYWAEIELRAPGEEGLFQWEAYLAERGDHAPAAYRFSLRTAPPPEYTVTLEVMEAFSEEPIGRAIILLDRYQGETDRKGVCRMEVPRGRFQLTIAKDGYRSYRSMIDVQGSLTVKVHLSVGASSPYSEIGINHLVLSFGHIAVLENSSI